MGLPGKIARSADAASRFLHAHDYPKAKTDIVWDAIALHSSADIAERREPEVALVHFGAHVDVMGLRPTPPSARAWPTSDAASCLGWRSPTCATSCSTLRSKAEGDRQVACRALRTSRLKWQTR